MDTIGNSIPTKSVDRFLILHRLGVGGILPKDDGNFLKRKATTNDKLLEQLIGKKKAKAHIAAKEQAERSGAQSQPKHARREVQKREESDDEEEGRAATFKSKRRKVARPKPAPVSDEEDGAEEDAPSSTVPKQDAPNVTVPDEPIEHAPQKEEPKDAPITEDGETDEPLLAAKKPKSMPSRTRAKPTSYLDELLAERSKKKKNKAKNKTAGDD
jgi:hypothetical protein